MTIFSKHLGGHGPFAPLGYAYGLDRTLPTEGGVETSRGGSDRQMKSLKFETQQ